MTTISPEPAALPPHDPAALDAWIRRAAGSYRRRLDLQWEDAVQDAHVKVLEALQSEAFEGRSSLQTYVWRLVNNVCIDAIRKLERSARSSAEEVLERFASPSSTSLVLERREARQLMLRVLEAVPRTCVEMWQMVIGGLSYREMSQQLEVSEGALRVRALRCRQEARAIRKRMLDREVHVTE